MAKRARARAHTQHTHTPRRDPSGKPRAYVYEEFFGVKGEKRKQTEGKQRGIDTSHWFAGLASKCYGREGVKPYEGKPMLCSGQLSGNRAGLMKVLTQYIDEMLKNVQKGPQCVTPEMPDQPLVCLAAALLTRC